MAASSTSTSSVESKGAMTLHRFWIPLGYMTLLSIAVSVFGYLYSAWVLRLRRSTEGTNPFLLKCWIAIGIFGPVFFILLKLGVF